MKFYRGKCKALHLWWNYHMNSRNWRGSSAKENELMYMLHELNPSSKEAKLLPVAAGRWTFPYVQHLWDAIWNTVSSYGLSHTRNTLSYWNKSSGKATRWLKVYYLEGKDERAEKTRQPMRGGEKTEPDTLLQGIQGQEVRQSIKVGAKKFWLNTKGNFSSHKDGQTLERVDQSCCGVSITELKTDPYMCLSNLI